MKEFFAKYLPVKGEIKVKLFLCSRDIQVGDNFYHPIHGKLKCIKKDTNGDISDREGSWHNSSFMYKIIGEISPKATWVKEGDSFDEDELCCFSQNGFKSGNKPTLLGFTKSANTPVYYGIKGPCGHFH